MSQENLPEIPLLTFNSLYNLLREEKKTKKLQHLPNLFYEALNKFLADKRIEITKLKSGSDPEKLKKEKLILKNSEKIVYELLNLRCTKISSIAIKNKLFGDDVLSKEDILEKELDFFNAVQKGLTTITKIL